MTARLIVIARNSNMPRLSGPAPTFDATAEQWIAPPSCMKQDAGAAAELRHTQNNTVLRCPPLSPRPLAVPSARGHLFLEAMTVALGILVFGAIAYVLLVLV